MENEFEPMTFDDLAKVLDLTIKHDYHNKIVTFLCMLSAFTEDAQFNISFNAPSSTGKSYIPTEIAKLFPAEDVREIGYCSPMAFFHDYGEFDKEKKIMNLNLSRVVLVFLDQPHQQLLDRLRPLLSHDKKEITAKITDKSERMGLRTKNIVIKGFPAVVFSTTGLRIDEQESTRFILLSPEISHEKIKAGIRQALRKESDRKKYSLEFDHHPVREEMRRRIKAIRDEKISDVRLPDGFELEKMFLEGKRLLKARHQRDIKKLVSIIKTTALLNLWWRDRDGDVIKATNEDVLVALELWRHVSASQELNLPPYVHKIFTEVIQPAWQEKRDQGLDLGIKRTEVQEKYYQLFDQAIEPEILRKQILPMLEAAGLIREEPSKDDKRVVLYYPRLESPISPDQNNRGNSGGVDLDTIYDNVERDFKARGDEINPTGGTSK